MSINDNADAIANELYIYDAAGNVIGSQCLTKQDIMDAAGLTSAQFESGLACLRTQAVTRQHIPIWDTAQGGYRLADYDAAAAGFHRYRRWRMKYMLTAARRLEAMCTQAIHQWGATPGLTIAAHAFHNLVRELEWAMAQPD